MYRRIRWDQEVEWLKAGLSGNGAFLNVNTQQGTTNPMTIGWGQVGVVWGRPVFTVFVRTSRYTYDCLRSAGSFTVCVPRLGGLADELALCGSRSGRDIDKIQAAGLHLVAGRSVDTPVIEECGLHYECRIVARTQLVDTDMACAEIQQRYEAKDLHQLTLGEIVDAYVLGGEA